MENSLTFISMLLQTFLALLAVCGLAYLIFRVVLPRLQLVNNSNGLVRVVERIGLDSRRSLFVVEVAGKWLLIGVSENGVNLVSELNEEEANLAETSMIEKRQAQLQKFDNLRVNFAEKLANVMSRKEIKKDARDQQNEKKQIL